MEQKSKEIQQMFDNIAGKYDLLNRLLSFRTDVRWRKKAIKLVGIANGQRVLDLACGTADMMIEMDRRVDGVTLVGGDFSYNMMLIGKQKFPKGAFSVADAHCLPFADNSFDRITISFGFRNVTDKPTGLKEMHRVLKDGGKLCILEFSQPEGPIFSRLYRLYFTKILPFIGGIISGNRKAYEYLPDSVYKFPKKDEYKKMILNAGFSEVIFNPMSFGICDATICVKK
ncbi:bifunctional demethylmenaquinone methyltransferase/2-methoxy-6-polyprenyl-1,4-benzoquinol methylase UbiE [Seleniivibrio woodruffii]|uniref:Demethylmenaquinone methyltransferase n=1 Tax=Seleniivibrio woodruffii TaxID=1078050 RepID=A0A4R1KBV0_9BACT|nr:bifunctional demethylmenaquinone methyltransferase/2-methoxy-6-polyprenyl-1,4-benzoquinol methylase UbiE [Seleniivibrio woodruffii]TCK62006.1 demethylmenaquinone methyltransferase [Seleniivibrio woodruffii]TVZ34877.1 demethylmenaquinone methyltransferase/2-methoxy-6-polyprenyl-1,4-benzoquinol methylase [Seleniivibrio woodruffii]